MPVQPMRGIKESGKESGDLYAGYANKKKQQR
jgi:hypothetical protein